VVQLKSLLQFNHPIDNVGPNQKIQIRLTTQIIANAEETLEGGEFGSSNK
jgi:hypothetical protein